MITIIYEGDVTNVWYVRSSKHWIIVGTHSRNNYKVDTNLCSYIKNEVCYGLL